MLADAAMKSTLCSAAPQPEKRPFVVAAAISEVSMTGLWYKVAVRETSCQLHEECFLESSNMSLGFHRRDDGSRRVTNRQIDFAGWVLFMLSATSFVIASVGSFWAMAGSIFFLVACIVFIIPFFRKDGAG